MVALPTKSPDFTSLEVTWHGSVRLQPERFRGFVPVQAFADQALTDPVTTLHDVTTHSVLVKSVALNALSAATQASQEKLKELDKELARQLSRFGPGMTEQQKSSSTPSTRTWARSRSWRTSRALRALREQHIRSHALESEAESGIEGDLVHQDPLLPVITAHSSGGRDGS